MFTGHSGGVRAIVTMGALQMWTGSDDHTLRVWDIESGQHSCWTFG